MLPKVVFLLYLCYNSKMDHYPYDSRDSADEELNDNAQIGEQLRDLSSIIIRFADLIEALPTHATPQRVSVELEFFARPELEPAYPEIVKNRLLTRDLKYIKVTSVDESGDEDGEYPFPTTSIEFVDEDGEIHISRDPSVKDGKTQDMLFENGGMAEIGRVSDEEISTFLFRLSSKPSDELIAEEDFLAQRIEASDVIDSLKKNAIAELHDYDFESPSGRILTLSFQKHGDFLRLSKFVIFYEAAGRNRISVEINPGQGFSMDFQTYEDEGDGTYLPDDRDYALLSEVLTEELKLLGQDGFDASDASA